jgi:hypothetical protein
MLLAVGASCAALSAHAADGHKRLLEQIPRSEPKVGDVVREIVDVGKRVRDPRERCRILSWSLHYRRHLAADEIEAVMTLLKEAADEIDDDRFLIGIDWCVAVDSNTAVELAERIEDPGMRDHYLTDVAERLSAADPKQAREVIERIQAPTYQSRAMAMLALNGKLDYEETKELLAKAAEAEWAHYRWGSFAYFFDNSLTRFAVGDPDGVSDFVVRHLEPDEAIGTLLRIGRELLHQHDAPQAAEVVLDRAADLIPGAANPHEHVPGLIGCGYGTLHPKRALEMFDRLVMPNIWRLRPGKGSRALAWLAAIDVETLISRAEQAPEGADATEIAARAIGYAASGVLTREKVLSWLKETPPGPIRDASIAHVAWRLWFRAGEESPEDVRRSLDTLWQATQGIRDPKTRWQACAAILRCAESADVEVPSEVREEDRRLWVDVRDQLSENQRKQALNESFGSLPHEEQRRQIRRWLTATDNPDQFPVATRFLGESTLPQEEKWEFCRQLIDQAEGDRLALSHVARSVATLDLPRALDMIWQVLPEVRDPTYGSTEFRQPPENAKSALGWVIPEGPWHSPAIFRAVQSKEDLPEVLWSWAGQVPDEDRDAVLEKLMLVLLRRDRAAEALGVARLAEDPHTRADLLARMATELADAGNTE